MDSADKQTIANRRHGDQVNHPSHYGGAENPYEVIKVLEAWASPTEFYGFLKLTIIKYQGRLGKKDAIGQDLAKAIWYSNYLEGWLERTGYGKKLSASADSWRNENSKSE